jgi:hypothetical protein
MTVVCMTFLWGFSLRKFPSLASKDSKWILSTSTMNRSRDGSPVKHNITRFVVPGSLDEGKNPLDLGSIVLGQPVDEGRVEREQSRVLNGLPTSLFRGEILQMC